MKQRYADVVTRFLADHGGLFRYYRARWWYLNGGSWHRDGRLDLERELNNFMTAYFNLGERGYNRSDMNQMCAYLSRCLETKALPGTYVEVADDPLLLRPWEKPYVPPL